MWPNSHFLADFLFPHSLKKSLMENFIFLQWWDLSTRLKTNFFSMAFQRIVYSISNGQIHGFNCQEGRVDEKEHIKISFTGFYWLPQLGTKKVRSSKTSISALIWNILCMKKKQVSNQETWHIYQKTSDNLNLFTVVEYFKFFWLEILNFRAVMGLNYIKNLSRGKLLEVFCKKRCFYNKVKKEDSGTGVFLWIL